MKLQSSNPKSGELITAYESMSGDAVDAILQDAHRAFERWRDVGFDERARLTTRVAEILRDDKDTYAELMADEMGKPLAEGRAEAEKCAWVCDYYAEHAESFLARELVETDAAKSYVAFEPLGVVLAIMPWNFPFWQVLRFAAPTLMAGNAPVLKHAPNVMGSALAIESIFKQAGFPAALFRALVIDVEQVPRVIDHPVVQAVTLTGSTRAGRAVASQAGAALKKAVLELGGSDPSVILDDADVAAAAETCVTSRLINSGQSCIAAKRFIVSEKNRDAFESRFVELMRAKRVGDPRDDDTDIGPLARVDLRDTLHEQVRKSVDRGARLLLGGELPDGAGAFYPPTVLTDVRKGMPAYEEELFGPVGAIIVVQNEDEALEVANDTAYGLGAAVYTRDVERGEKIAATQLDAGACFVNGFVRSDPRLPFGGIKQSGYGRELSAYGIREFVNVKTVYVS